MAKIIVILFMLQSCAIGHDYRPNQDPVIPPFDVNY
jgi:hypothetical protein